MGQPHPRISAWTRDEHDGDYRALLQGWSLRVEWHGNGHATRGGFRWTAKRDDENHEGHEAFAEMEWAMADAEHFVRVHEARRAAEIGARAEDASEGSPVR